MGPFQLVDDAHQRTLSCMLVRFQVALSVECMDISAHGPSSQTIGVPTFLNGEQQSTMDDEDISGDVGALCTALLSSLLLRLLLSLLRVLQVASWMSWMDRLTWSIERQLGVNKVEQSQPWCLLPSSLLFSCLLFCSGLAVCRAVALSSALTTMGGVAEDGVRMLDDDDNSNGLMTANAPC